MPRLPGPSRRRAARPARGRRRGLGRRRLSAIGAGLCALTLFTAAWLHDGVSQADLDLNDGGVWVTNTSEHLVGRLNYPSRQLDSAVRTSSQNFDVTQAAEDVLVPDTDTTTVSVVDPALVEFVSRTQLEAGTTTTQGGDRVLAISGVSGTVRATGVETVSGLAEAAPLVEDMPGLVAVAGTDGSVHAASSASGTVVTVPATSSGWGEASSEPLGGASGTDLAITAVGEDTVVLERGTGVLHLPDGVTTDLGEPGLSLQQPGPDADAVLVASRTALYTVPLDGAGPTRVEAASEGEAPAGVPAQPVRLAGCDYAAWAGSGQFVRQCDGHGAEVLHDDLLASSTSPVFRVNRDVIVLNDAVAGSVWLPDENLVLIDNWTDATAQTDDASEQTDDSAETTESEALPERTEENHPPEANDDSYGVRPGRATTLPVLSNDYDQDGDVLTVTVGESGSLGEVRTVRAGRAVQIDVPEDATGTTTIAYSAEDGRGMSDSAVATVEVRPWSVNEAPVQEEVPTLSLTQGATGSLDVLGGWHDPDGDTVYLVSAQAEGLDVRSTQEGTVSVRDVGGATGRTELTLVVSDGRETATGTVHVDVEAAGEALPVANADYVRVVAGSRTVVSPLDNDTSPTGAVLRLAQVEQAPAGTRVEVDQQAGTFTFSSEHAQTYYLTYGVMDGPSMATGVVRVDVVEKADATVPPDVEDDTALLRDGGWVTIAPLANDFDPSGGVLVLQSVSVPSEAGVTVTVVDHSLLQVAAADVAPDNVGFDYTVSNGVSSTTGHVTVVPVAADDLQVPVVVDDNAVVRTGDVVTVAVLDNDSSPSGLALSTGDHLSLLGDELGTAWVSQDVLRFRAGSTAGRTTIGYTVVDDHGQSASGSVEIEVRGRDDDANVAPRPVNLEARTVSGSPVTIPVPLDGIDSDGDSVSLVGLDQAPTLGTVTTGSTWLTYTPSQGVLGTDSFTYTVQDRFGAQATATVRVGVASRPSTNTPPVAADDLVVAQPGRDVAVDVLSNDLDADDDHLTLTGTPSTDDPALGVSVRAGRVLLDLPTQEGVHSARYTVSDGRGGTDTGTLTAQVRTDAPLVAPVGVDDYVTLDQIDATGQVVVPVLDNDSDPDGSPWDLTLGTEDPDATVAGEGISVTVGDERRLVLYTLTDQDGLTGHAVIVVPGRSELRPRLDTASVPVHVPAGTTTDIPLADHVVTRSGTTASITDESTIRAGVGTDGSSLWADATTLRITPAAGFTGQTSVTFEVADGSGPDALTAVVTLPVVVDPGTNAPPTFTPTEVSVAPGEGAVTVDLALMTTDPDEGDLARMRYAVGSTPEGFSVSLAGSALTVSAAQDVEVGTTGSLPVTVDDGVSDPVGTTVPLTVVASTYPLMSTTPVTIDSPSGDPVSVDLATVVTNPFPDRPVSVYGTPAVTSGSGEVSASGTVLTIVPGDGFQGRLVVGYRLMDATGNPSRAVSGTVIVTVSGVPGAPSAVTAAPSGTSEMLVNWVPGADNGSPVTGYTVTEVGSGSTTACTASPCLVTGLTANRSYSFRVVAHNAVGDSAPSAASAPVTLTVVPDTPSTPVLASGQDTLTATWSAVPGVGTPLSYEVVLQPGNHTATVTGTSAVFSVPTIVNGQGYRATVRAVLPDGTASGYSGVSSPAASWGAPGAPGQPQASIGSATSGEAQVAVSWGSAAENGAPVTYAVRVSGSRSLSVDAGSSTSTTVSLPTGSYTFAVTATNRAGSATSASSATLDIQGVPPSPSVPVAAATGLNGQLTVATAATARDGNGWSMADQRVQYSVDGSRWTTGTTFTGLADGVPVTLQARTVTATGETSPPVSAAAVAPYGPPSGPSVSCTATSTSVSCSWTAGATGGLATSYRQSETGSDADATGVSPGQGATFNVGAGAERTWCVKATNAAGSSAWSCASARTSISSGSFQVITDDPALACNAQDLLETGFPAGRCWHLRIRVAGFAPGSQVTCSFRPSYSLTDYSETFAVDSSGGAVHDFARYRTSDPGYKIPCWQK